jgi:multiple antibiotic resistance protein
LEHAFHDFINLFVVFNPTGIVPQYLYFTRNVPPESRRELAIRCVLIATAILIAFIVLGQILLEALGITLPSFNIAGGIVLLVISLRMIFESTQQTAGEDKEDKDRGSASLKELAVFPLATPLIAGPGGILIVVLLTDNNHFSIPEQTATTLVLLAIMAFTYLVLLSAEKVQRLLGITGINMMSRVSGLILAALSVETIQDGISASIAAGQFGQF